MFTSVLFEDTLLPVYALEPQSMLCLLHVERLELSIGVVLNDSRYCRWSILFEKTIWSREWRS